MSDSIYKVGVEAALSRATEKTQKIIELSLREALSLGTDYVGSEHLLLAMLREPETLAYKALTAFATAEEYRNEVIFQLTGKGSPPLADGAERQRNRTAVKVLAKRLREIADEVEGAILHA